MWLFLATSLYVVGPQVCWLEKLFRTMLCKWIITTFLISSEQFCVRKGTTKRSLWWLSSGSLGRGQSKKDRMKRVWIYLSNFKVNSPQFKTYLKYNKNFYLPGCQERYLLFLHVIYCCFPVVRIRTKKSSTYSWTNEYFDV